MSVRVSPISRTAAILIIFVGAFLLFTGSVAGVLANEVAGAAFIVLGLVMYMLLLRFTRKLARNVEDVKNQAAGIVAGANLCLWLRAKRNLPTAPSATSVDGLYGRNPS